MFCIVNVRSLRWWIVGLLLGLAGWAIWARLERTSEVRVPLAFERNFWPPRPVPAVADLEGGPEGVPAQGARPGAANRAGEEVAPAVAGVPEQTPGAEAPAAARLEADAFRAQRERLRGQEMELARQVLEDPDASDSRKSQAQQELAELLRRSRREVEIEELLKAAGVTDAVVSIGEGGVQVVVAQPLSAQGAARIGELVARMAGARREHISIIDSLTAFGGAGGWEESPPPR